ncbi:N-acetyltransferase [Ktedonosporobacter rubrisoli]|uniref:N-acetyltransferase n=1 Tax=Ktedonosporobacter rubrisoli TaxID=2509675 RepID=A0A4P6JXR3_KTERU|nr:GNAT family protein [Ktedonosporobacter rubrisoli]QBD80558.1 N-acetyltransferase [Ktedonosporobacter rubrisoli]
MAIPPLHQRLDNYSVLRPLDERDAQEIFELVERNRPHLRAWLPWLDVTRTADDERVFLRSLAAQYASNNSFSCAILYKGKIAGTVSYHPINWSNRKVELGYWLAEEFQGKGLMTRACQAMITYAFHTMKLNKVEIRCATENVRSRAIPERLGFKEEGLIRQAEWLYDHYVDLVVYGLLASEWPPK